MAALRVSESLFKKGDKTFAADVLAATKDKDANVVIQAMLTARQLDLPDWKTTLAALVTPQLRRSACATIGNAILNPPAQTAAATMTPEQQKLFKGGRDDFSNPLRDLPRRGRERPAASPGPRPARCLRPRSPARRLSTAGATVPLRFCLHGLTGDIDGKKYEGQMIAMATNDDIVDRQRRAQLRPQFLW